jgi:hypothetical protein
VSAQGCQARGGEQGKASQTAGGDAATAARASWPPLVARCIKILLYFLNRIRLRERKLSARVKRLAPAKRKPPNRALTSIRALTRSNKTTNMVLQGYGCGRNASEAPDAALASPFGSPDPLMSPAASRRHASIAGDDEGAYEGYIKGGEVASGARRRALTDDLDLLHAFDRLSLTDSSSSICGSGSLSCFPSLHTDVSAAAAGDEAAPALEYTPPRSPARHPRRAGRCRHRRREDTLCLRRLAAYNCYKMLCAASEESDHEDTYEELFGPADVAEPEPEPELAASTAEPVAATNPAAAEDYWQEDDAVGGYSAESGDERNSQDDGQGRSTWDDFSSDWLWGNPQELQDSWDTEATSPTTEYTYTDYEALFAPLPEIDEPAAASATASFGDQAPAISPAAAVAAAPSRASTPTVLFTAPLPAGLPATVAVIAEVTDLAGPIVIDLTCDASDAPIASRTRSKARTAAPVATRTRSKTGVMAKAAARSNVKKATRAA